MTTYDQWDIVTSVGVTALVVAAGRSMESHRPDPLVVDPFAESLVRSAQAPIPLPTRLPETEQSSPEMAGMWQGVADYMGVRTRFFDRFFQRAAQTGVSQAVILASGLDTRAFRLDWPEGFRLFELDQPEVLRYKDDVLDREAAGARCARHAIGQDLRGDWAGALQQAGFDEGRPTAWLAEGLLPYLPPDAEEALLDRIHALSAPGSQVTMEHSSGMSSVLASQAISEASAVLDIDMHQLIHDDDRPAPDAALASRGWSVTVDPIGDVASRSGRAFSDFWQSVVTNGRYVTATRPA